MRRPQGTLALRSATPHCLAPRSSAPPLAHHLLAPASSQVRTLKRCCIAAVPDTLVVHLKRFEYGRSGGAYGYFMSTRRGKLETFIEYPVRGLDLAPFVRGPVPFGDDGAPSPLLYDLYAVSEHMGGMQGGHYTATARNWGDGKWYHFDDGSVSASSGRNAVSHSGYVLFYARRGAQADNGDDASVVDAVRRARVASTSPPESDVDMTLGGSSAV